MFEQIGIYESRHPLRKAILPSRRLLTLRERKASFSAETRQDGMGIASGMSVALCKGHDSLLFSNQEPRLLTLH